MNKHLVSLLCAVMTALCFAMTGCDDDDDSNRSARQCVDQPLGQAPNAYTCNDAYGRQIYSCRQEVNGDSVNYVCRDANGAETSHKCVSGCGSSSSSTCNNGCTSCGGVCNCNCNNTNNGGSNNGSNNNGSLEVWFAKLPQNIDSDQWWSLLDSILREFQSCRPNNCSGSRFQFAGYGSSSGSGTIPNGQQAAYVLYDPNGSFSVSGGEIWGAFLSNGTSYDFGPNRTSFSFPSSESPNANYAVFVATGSFSVTDN